jgi:hypothetical protein
LGDIDGDGDVEVVVGSMNGKIYAWHHDGTLVLGWPKEIGNSVSTSPVLGDIDGDGNMEVIISGDDKIYAWHHDGTLVLGWPKEGSPALGDIDSDGDVEIVVGSEDGNVYAWHHDGTLVSGWPKETGDSIRSFPALGDIDGDGDVEVVVGSYDGKVYAWHHDGTLVSGWPKETGDSVFSSPALGDIDGDGDVEVIVGSMDSKVYAWHHDGTLVSGWPNLVSGWPERTGDLIYSSPALGDIDGDGDIEVVVGSYYGCKVYAWRHDGTLVESWPKKTGDYVDSSPALGDVDSDGDVEVVVGSHDGNVYAWDCPGRYNPDAMPWPMFRHDAAHTGFLKKTIPPTPSISVWPGDTDNNGIVDGRDILPVSMYWKKTGQTRIPASTAWEAQQATPWTPQEATYADADGNGIIDGRDILPIGANWKKTHPGGTPAAPYFASPALRHPATRDIYDTRLDHTKYLSAYQMMLKVLEENPIGKDAIDLKQVLRELIALATRPIPLENLLGQNFPNPFNPETWIPYQLAQEADVVIEFYDVSGRLVQTLSLGKKEAGMYLTKDTAAHWDGRNSAGEKVSSGIFFYCIKAGTFSALRKMVIMK